MDVVITASLVADLVAAQFPAWAGLPIRPIEVDGWDNRTFRLGEHMAVRLPSAQAYAAQIGKEHRWLPVLAPPLPVPIPEPLGRGDPSDLFPLPWSVRRWLPGEPATGDRVRDLPALATNLAGFLSRLAEIDPREAALQRLLGPTRAGILRRLDQPASTTHLVALTGLSLGTVGAHLRILLDACLVERRRSGATVLYYRTPLGQQLLDKQHLRPPTARAASNKCARPDPGCCRRGRGSSAASVTPTSGNGRMLVLPRGLHLTRQRRRHRSGQMLTRVPPSSQSRSRGRLASRITVRYSSRRSTWSS